MRGSSVILRRDATQKTVARQAIAFAAQTETGFVSTGLSSERIFILMRHSRDRLTIFKRLTAASFKKIDLK